jgi:L-lysine 2,3-aminomutase
VFFLWRCSPSFVRKLLEGITTVLSLLHQNSAVLIPNQLPVYCPCCTRTTKYSYQTIYNCTVRTAPEQRSSHTKPITSVLSVLHQNNAVLIPNHLQLYCSYCTRTTQYSYQTIYNCTVRTAPEQRSSHTKPITSVLSVLHQNSAVLLPNQLPVHCSYCTRTAQFSYQTNYQCTLRTAPEQRSSRTKPITSALFVLHQNSAVLIPNKLPVYCPYCTRRALFSYQTNYQCTVLTAPEERSSHTKSFTSVLSVLHRNSAVLIPNQLPVYCPYCTRTAQFSYQTNKCFTLKLRWHHPTQNCTFYIDFLILNCHMFRHFRHLQWSHNKI